MFRSSLPRHPFPIRLLIPLLTAIVMLLMSFQMALADGTSISGSDSPAVSPVTVIATPATDQSLIEQIPGDDDVVLVVSVAAVTVLGLTGLAMLDRKHEVVVHDSQSDHPTD